MGSRDERPEGANEMGRLIRARDWNDSLGPGRGMPEEAWMDLFYSPVIGDIGRPGGVIAMVVETTERVVARRAAVTPRPASSHGVGYVSTEAAAALKILASRKPVHLLVTDVGLR
jgi:hypothetical protein